MSAGPESRVRVYPFGQAEEVRESFDGLGLWLMDDVYGRCVPCHRHPAGGPRRQAALSDPCAPWVSGRLRGPIRGPNPGNRGERDRQKAFQINSLHAPADPCSPLPSGFESHQPPQVTPVQRPFIARCRAVVFGVSTVEIFSPVGDVVRSNRWLPCRGFVISPTPFAAPSRGPLQPGHHHP
jgi:hypothetical protein